jgi:hypothetical protein
MIQSTNPRICAFYKANPTIDFDTVNLCMIDLLEQFISPTHTETRTRSSSLEEIIMTMNTQLTGQIMNLHNDNTVRQQVNHTKFLHDVGELLKINEAHSKKSGDTSLQKLNHALNSIYSTAECIKQGDPSSSSSSSCLMKRYMKIPILFETTNSEENVSADAVLAFTKTLEEKHCHGIFLSHTSGFVSKPNYHIEYHKGNIAVFIHHVDYSAEKIKLAVDLIDALSLKLKEIHVSERDDTFINKAVLDDINKEYQLFVSQKEALITIYKDCQKKVLSQIDEFRFPCLDKYLSTKYTHTVQKQGFKCDLCKCFNANNLKALAAHKRGCARKANVLTVHI